MAAAIHLGASEESVKASPWGSLGRTLDASGGDGAWVSFHTASNCVEVDIKTWLMRDARDAVELKKCEWPEAWGPVPLDLPASCGVTSASIELLMATWSGASANRVVVDGARDAARAAERPQRVLNPPPPVYEHEKST